MAKIPSSRFFLKYYTDILKGPIKAREALIYAIVAEFQGNEATCFISRKELGKRINESEHSAERGLQTLIKAGLIKTKRQGRLRHLYINKKGFDLCAGDTDQKSDVCAGANRSVRNEGVDLCAGDTLIRSINQINNNQINDHVYNNINNTHVRPEKIMAQRQKDDGFTLRGWWDGLSAQERDELVTYTARVANPYEKNMLGSDLAAPSRSALSVLFNHSAKLDQLKASLPD